MQKVSNESREAQLNLIEMVKDYGRKLTPGSVARVSHQQDDYGATLVLHVQGGNVADSAGLAKLSERLKTASESVAAELAAAAEAEQAKAATETPAPVPEEPAKPARTTRTTKAVKAEAEATTPENEQAQQPAAT